MKDLLGGLAGLALGLIIFLVLQLSMAFDTWRGKSDWWPSEDWWYWWKKK